MPFHTQHLKCLVQWHGTFLFDIERTRFSRGCETCSQICHFLCRCVCFDESGKVVAVVVINNNEQHYIYEDVKNRLNLENACNPA